MVLAAGGDCQLFGRPLCRARAAIAWHGTLSEMGMVVISSTISAGPIGQTLSEEASRSARAARRWRTRFHGSPTISSGGWKRRRRSGRASSRRIEIGRAVGATTACRPRARSAVDGWGGEGSSAAGFARRVDFLPGQCDPRFVGLRRVGDAAAGADLPCSSGQQDIASRAVRSAASMASEPSMIAVPLRITSLRFRCAPFPASDCGDFFAELDPRHGRR